jgi:hypothetical protein
MRVTDDSGKVLNAEYSMQEDKDRLALTLESAGGRTRSGVPRNADYRIALTLLLTRLKERRAILLDAVVDSANTRRHNIPERDRRLIISPIRLADRGDMETLRGELTSAQGRIGQPTDAAKAGNSSKRIRLVLDAPGYDPGDADQLAADLAAPLRLRGDEPPGSFVIDGQRRVRALASLLRPEAAITAEDVLEALRGLRMQEGSDGLAKRHQPLTLLWAIGRARQRKDRMAPWPVARTGIGELIRRFGRGTDARNPYLPFLALNGTDLWELTADPPRRGTGADARRRWLNNTKPFVGGGLTQPVYDLMADTEAATKVVATLLDTYFNDIDPGSLLHGARLHDLAEALTPGGLGSDIDDPEKEEQRAAEALLRALASDSTVVEAEASHVESTQYERKAGNVTVWRGEAQLVARYRRTLPDTQAKRIRLAVGWTDLYRVKEADLIEAKVSARHRYVRQALGQLLDYAAHCTLPVNRLTALFPTTPPPSDIQLLHAYGIDCLYWAGGEKFPRLEAPAEARERIATAWSTLAQP